MTLNAGLVFLALVRSIAFAAPDAPASDPCRCQQYKSLESFTSLADEIAAIGTSPATPLDGSLTRDDEARRQALRLRVESDSLIPDECKKQLLRKIDGVHVNLFARLYVGGSPVQAPPSQTAADGLYSSYNKAYTSYLTKQWSAACSSNPTTQCTQSAIGSAWQSFGGLLASNPDLVGLGTQAGFGAGDVAIMKAFNGVMSASSEQAMLAQVASKSDGLSNAQFMELVQMVGMRLGNDYDNSRAAQVISAPGAVTGNQLLAAAQNDTMNGSFSTGSALAQFAANNYQDAGVCRDIMTLQAKMLEARGFPNAYTLSYGTAGPDFHTVAISGDPDNPLAFHVFSYDLRTDNQDVDGSEGLFQRTSPSTIGVPDTALSYRLAKPEGAVVADIPSSMQKFLAEAAGFDIRQSDPLARETSSMFGSNVSYTTLNGKTTVDARVFVGQDGVGGQYAGVGTSVSYGQGTIAPGKVGLVVADQLRPASVYGTQDNENMALAYLQAEQHLAPKLRLGEAGTLTFDNSATLTAMTGWFAPALNGGPAGSTGADGDSSTEAIDGDLRLRSEIRFDQQLAGGALHSQYRVGAQVSPGLTDVRDIDMLGNPSPLTLSLNSVYAGTTQTLRVKDLLLFADATAAADALGSRGIAQIGAAGEKWSTSAFIAGRITNATALYEDNTIRRVGVSATYRPVRNLALGLTGEMPIEGDAPLSQAHLMATAIVSF